MNFMHFVLSESFDSGIMSNRKKVETVIKFRLKVLLAMNEMTQMQLSEKTGVRQPTISAICTGSAKHLPVDVLDKICTVLNCQPGDIMEYIPDEK